MEDRTIHLRRVRSWLWRELGSSDHRGHFSRSRRRTRGAAGRGGDAIDDRPESREVAERLSSVRELKPGATRVVLSQRHVDEARVLADRARHVALVRERRGEAPVRGKVGRSDGDSLEQQRDRARAISTLRESARRFTECRQSRTDILLRGLRACETAVRVDVAPLLNEFAERDLGLPGFPILEKLGSRFGRATVSAVLRLLRRTTCRECGCKLLSALLTHRARRLRAHARDQGVELSGTHGVGVDAERVEFSSEEGLRSGPEIALGYTEQLLRKRVQSSPVVASSDNA